MTHQIEKCYKCRSCGFYGHGNRFVSAHLDKECSGKSNWRLINNQKWLTEETKERAEKNTDAHYAYKRVLAQKRVEKSMKLQMIADIESLRESYRISMENLLENPKMK